jgi:hypothetical protein
MSAQGGKIDPLQINLKLNILFKNPAQAENNIRKV